MAKQAKNRLGTKRSSAILSHEAKLWAAAKKSCNSTDTTEYRCRVMSFPFFISGVFEDLISPDLEERHTRLEAEHAQNATRRKKDQCCNYHTLAVCNTNLASIYCKFLRNFRCGKKFISSNSIVHCRNHHQISILSDSQHVFLFGLLVGAADKIIALHEPLIDLVIYNLTRRISYAPDFR